METIRTTLPAARVAAVRAQVPMSELTRFYDRAYARVQQVAEQQGWRISGPAVGWYHGMPTDTVDLAAGFLVDDVDLGVTVDGVEVLDMPGGEALVLTHAGPYTLLPDAWDLVEQERVTLGVDGRGDFWEEYVTDPSPDGDPDMNVTRLVLPLRA